MAAEHTNVIAALGLHLGVRSLPLYICSIMNAFQPSRPPLKPEETRRVASRPRRYRRRRPYRVMALETTAKLTVNVVLSAIAIAGLVKLLPYQLSQQEKLQEIHSEVQQTEARVNRLRTDFNRYFDPQQATIIMQEQSNRVAPEQRQVILLDKSTTHVKQKAKSP